MFIIITFCNNILLDYPPIIRHKILVCLGIYKRTRNLRSHWHRVSEIRNSYFVHPVNGLLCVSPYKCHKLIILSSSSSILHSFDNSIVYSLNRLSVLFLLYTMNFKYRSLCKGLTVPFPETFIRESIFGISCDRCKLFLSL